MRQTFSYYVGDGFTVRRRKKGAAAVGRTAAASPQLRAYARPVCAPKVRKRAPHGEGSCAHTAGIFRMQTDAVLRWRNARLLSCCHVPTHHTNQPQGTVSRPDRQQKRIQPHLYDKAVRCAIPLAFPPGEVSEQSEDGEGSPLREVK